MTTDLRAVRASLATEPDDDVLVVVPSSGPSLRTDTSVGQAVDAALHAIGGGRHLLVEHDTRTPVVIGDPRPASGGATIREVLVDGFRFEVRTESDHLAALRERATRARPGTGRTGPLEVRAVIPGKVVAVSVEVGDTVSAGTQLLVVEAMKMQNELRAPRDGTIERVGAAVGQNLEIGDVLVVIG